jgi:signal transduction histidine kinase/CheY-like chemotaxis protein
MMKGDVLTLEIRLERDVVAARQRARQISALFGFDTQDQTRISTALSEMARNCFKYAGGGRIEFSVQAGEAPVLLIAVTDQGPGIPNLAEILDGRYHSNTGMGLGILGSKRLMDLCEIDSAPGQGTKVLLGKRLPRNGPPLSQQVLSRVADELASQRPSDPIEEIQQQNQELLRTLDALRQERERLAQINRELEETNRGVVALYAELDERADSLQRANDIKTRFLSNMTHEFRTPLNSITSLTRILLQRLDGELTSEQEKQVRFIQKSADALSELVNDLLDLAKVEAGKILVKPTEWTVVNLFGTLRGMLRPLLAQNTAVDLVFIDPEPNLTLHTDESKVSQILRNFISNALKYTERGEVRVSARTGADNTIVFVVTDTGIGIAEADQARIFEEYSQVDNPLQQRLRGTGLGLPLSRKLANLLGGSVDVQSRPANGSSFFAIIPAEFNGPREVSLVPELSREVDPTRLPLLVVEDNRESLFIYEKYLKGTGYQVLPARTINEARQWLHTVRPVAILLDILLETQSTWGFLSELRAQECYANMPILIVTLVDNEKRARSLGADAFHVKPIDRDWLISALEELINSRPIEELLVIDEDEVSRYLLRGLLSSTRFRVIEARDGREGLLLARDKHPKAIFLDLMGLEGYSVLRVLKSDPQTQDIPVIIHTSKRLTDDDREQLRDACTILPKEGDSREAQLAAVHDALVQAGLGSVPERKVS